MKIKCMLDQRQYQNKPQGKEIGAITNRLVSSNVEIEINELAEGLTRGQTFKPSFLNGKGEDNWLQTQLFALDFDENTTIETELNRCKELNILPCFGYTSFSHTTEHHKFRLVFCNDTIITNYDIAKQLQLTFMDIFKNCDIKCKNLSRLYFGGRQLIYNEYENRINHIKLIEKYPITIENKPVKTTSKTSNINIREKTIHNKNKKQYDNQIFNNNCDIYIKCIQNLDAKTLRNLIISRVQGEGVFGGLIEEDIYSYFYQSAFSPPHVSY